MPSLPYRRLLVGALALSLVPVSSALAGGTVKVTMDEFTLKSSPKSVSAGKVVFDARNDGADRHELVVLRTSTAASKLPQSGGRASEKGRVGDTGVFAGGKSKKLTVTLKKGHYVLVCNLPGHYAGGMRADFTVK
ncbi:hypothetical protein DVA67_027275 [Solirubrobacter sp. CPCC 204708]|uniref:Plastocyanin/azurin family copper-binding protein n=1 Tax=Solirubrobacter deserti TaxID=2282478 RepID=A0ABT4RG91_9ACTN|nr:plastocyanin/azurin family copper-binding protein [Solirubrobacter deserti]MBE2319701.1 hypothetical protein [Solirubrobacter deserti]MDA0137559.1 plastocyanin/azurin family copper-binding protein [Solirubrobacter deserti]